MNTQATLDLLRTRLLILHKALLDMERVSYERKYGKVGSTAFLNLLLEHEEFDWLRKISRLIVWIDEVLDPKEPTAEQEIKQLFDHARKLLTPADFGEDFVNKYQDALQRNPDAIMAHKEVRDVLKHLP